MSANPRFGASFTDVSPKAADSKVGDFPAPQGNNVRTDTFGAMPKGDELGDGYNMSFTG